MRPTKRWLIGVLSLSLALMACGLPFRQAEGPTPGAGEAPGQGEESEAPGTYTGLGLDQLDSYAASFEVRFTPDDGTISPWAYTVNMLATGGGEASQRSLSITGITGSKNPGDVTLTQLGRTQYLTGPGVANYFDTVSCLISPVDVGGANPDVDLDASFMTPDDFLKPADLGANLIPDGEETVASVAGQRYRIEADSLGDLSSASGTIVLARDGGYALRYDLTGRMVDRRFTDDLPGAVTWHYVITSLEPGIRLGVPEECAIPYPVMEDAFGLTWFGELLAYASPSSRAAVTAFYQEALPASGWTALTSPEENDTSTTLNYQNTTTGKGMIVIITDEGDGVVVNLVVD